MATRVGIFGGSFNPPHIAHLIIAEIICEQFELDYILWIPNYIPPHKPSVHFADAFHRLQMTRRAIEHNQRFYLSEIELDRKGTSFTLDTVRMLRNKNPDTSYYLIIGGDSLEEFMSWHQPEEIIRLVPLIVYNRPGTDNGTSEAETRFPERISFASAPLIDISSTAVRQRIQEGKTIQYLVPDPVRKYIQEHQLYL